MSNYNSLKTTINANIKQNGVQSITGQILNSILNQMVTNLGVGYQYAGIATTATNPGTPDAKVFYIANGAGTYTNFGGLSVTEDEVVVLYWDTSWHVISTGIVSKKVTTDILIELGLMPIKQFVGIAPSNSYEYGFVGGHTYRVCILGNVGVTVSTRNTPTGATIDNLGFLQPNSENLFTATQDAAYLRLGAAGGTGTISLSVQDITAPSANIKKALDDASMSVDKVGNGETLTFTPVASTSVECNFIKDHTYKIEYIAPSPSNVITLSTRLTANGDTIDMIGLISGGGVRMFVATAKANYLRFGTSVPTGSIVKVTDVSSLEYGKRVVDSLLPNLEETPFYFTEAGVMEYAFVKDRVYLLKNSSSSTILLSTRQTPTGSVLDGAWSLAPGASMYVKTTSDAMYLRCSAAGYGSISTFIKNGELRSDIDLLLSDSLIYEQGAILINGEEASSDIRIRTKNRLKGNNLMVAPNGLRIFRAIYYNNGTGLFDSYMDINNRVSFIGKDNCFARVVFCSDTDSDMPISIGDYVQYGSNSLLQEQITSIMRNNIPVVAPFVNFDLADDTLLDMADELDGMDFHEVDSLGCRTFMEQIYAKFDDLCSSYPEYVTKVDAAQYVGKSYPRYASLGGQAASGYLATPTYKMYMYKLTTYDSNANKGTNAKKKVFIAAGLHGWEHASQWNTFIIASKLCKLASENYYALRSCYDFYFVPVVNGYGAYHYQRQNANGVDINRNFPNPNWSKSGVPGDYGYTGESAASEFETQVIMSLVEAINPDIAIDHHSYGGADYNFYIETNDVETFKISHNVLTKWAHKCVTEYPQYYGTKFGFHSNITNTIGGVDTIFTLNRWLYWYKKSKVSATWELCHCIAYLNNISDATTAEETWMGEDIVKLNEFMTRLLLMLYLPLIG